MIATKHLGKIVASVAAVSLSLAACGSSTSSSSSAAAPATTEPATTTSAPPATTGTQVAVALGETDVMNQYMKVDQTTVPAGQVTFNVANDGVKKHEFVVLSTDTPADKLTMEGDEVVEDDYSAVDEIDGLDGGASGTLTVDLAPGHYALICNLKGHYRMGMYTELTVQ